MKKTAITDISEPRYLIVTADDLCMTEGITEGIVEAYRFPSDRESANALTLNAVRELY